MNNITYIGSNELVDVEFPLSIGKIYFYFENNKAVYKKATKDGKRPTGKVNLIQNDTVTVGEFLVEIDTHKRSFNVKTKKDMVDIFQNFQRNRIKNTDVGFKVDEQSLSIGYNFPRM